jgi:hypothetical protein
MVIAKYIHMKRDKKILMEGNVELNYRKSDFNITDLAKCFHINIATLWVMVYMYYGYSLNHLVKAIRLENSLCQNDKKPPLCAGATKAVIN